MTMTAPKNKPRVSEHTRVEYRRFKSEIFAQQERIGKALANAVRLELLDLLAQSDKTVETLARESGQTVGNTSQHLKMLRAARLVDARKDGLYVHCRLADPRVAPFVRSLRLLAEDRLTEIESITRRFLAGHDDMEPVDRQTLLTRVRDGEVTVLDVRPAEEYRAGHLPGAMSIPLEHLERRLKELPRKKEIVAYCRGPYCVLAMRAVELLRRKGYHAVRLADGVEDWRANGFEIAAGE